MPPVSRVGQDTRPPDGEARRSAALPPLLLAALANLSTQVAQHQRVEQRARLMVALDGVGEAAYL
jgi:hypothetical protein